ncbi:MAG: acylphosphatase [Methanotrichaceae archaeon]|nr:acylphosphatase [Methanotrichaceae archaeon]
MTMKLTAIVSGKVQEVGYRGRVMDIAIAFGLKGMVENLKDGRVKIIAEGEEEKIKWFESAIDIKNSLIVVSSIEKGYSPAGGEFEKFGKLVGKGETDTRLDTAAVYLKELVFAVNNMNDNLGGKMDQMLGKQDLMLSKQDSLLDEVRSMNDNLGGKMDQMLGKQDQMLGKQDQMLTKQDSLLDEVRSMNDNLGGKMDQMLGKQDDLLDEARDANRKLGRVQEKDIVELKSDMAEVKSALKAKGII